MAFYTNLFLSNAGEPSIVRIQVWAWQAIAGPLRESLVVFSQVPLPEIPSVY